MKKILAIIPARSGSTRFQDKPLADIWGRPMIWWVHMQLQRVPGIHEVVVATDGEKIYETCKGYGIRAMMTSADHPTHLDRLCEVAQKVEADYYLNINGDEPLVKPEYILPLLPPEEGTDDFYAANAMTLIKLPVEVVDTARIKVATDAEGYALYLARTPIPYPKASAKIQYKKFVGIQCFSRSALLFCGETPRGELEGIEDIDEYRFLEHGKRMRFVLTEAETLSVDTPKDLLRVREVIRRRVLGGEIQLPEGCGDVLAAMKQAQ